MRFARLSVSVSLAAYCGVRRNIGLDKPTEGDDREEMIWDELREIGMIESAANGGDEAEDESLARQMMLEFNEIAGYETYQRLLPVVRVNRGLNQVYKQAGADVARDALEYGYSNPENIQRRLAATEVMVRDGFYPLFLFLMGSHLCGNIKSILDGTCDLPIDLDVAVDFLREVTSEMSRILGSENGWESSRVRKRRGGPEDQALIITVDGYGRGDR